MSSDKEIEEFVKKPMHIEATQWDGTAEDAVRIINWVLDNNGTARYEDKKDLGRATNIIHIETMEGAMAAGPKWYIIKGIKGEFYPCEENIFHGSYSNVRSAYSEALSELDGVIKLALATLERDHRLTAHSAIKSRAAKVVEAAREEERDAEPKEFYNEGTLDKIYSAGKMLGFEAAEVTNFISEIQNAGILFRERI